MKRLTTEQILTHPKAFGLTTPTPLQLAIVRCKDGIPLGNIATHPTVIEGFGGPEAVAEIVRMSRDGVRPAEMLVIAAVRTFKSLFAAASVVEGSQNVDVTGLGAGDIVRIPIFSLKLSIKAVLSHLVGNLQARPLLRSLIIGDPLDNSVTLRHPSGRPILAEQVAMGSTGEGMISDFHGHTIGDEVPRMCGQDDGAKNFDVMRTASAGRRLPGGQGIWIGSPHAPFGPAYDLVTEHWCHPSPDIVIVRGTGPSLNPHWWTPERCADLKRRNPAAYRTDVLGEFADPETSLLSTTELDRVTRSAPAVLEPQEGQFYEAMIDPAARRNAFTLAVVTRRPDGKLAVVLCKEWQPRGEPLSPEAVLREIRDILRPYKVTDLYTDQWSFEAIKDIGRRHGLELITMPWTAQRKVELFEALRVAIADGAIELPPDPKVREDLLRIKKRVTQAGVAIELPKTSDGRHADYASVLALAMGVYLPEADQAGSDVERDEPERPRRSDPWDKMAREFGLMSDDGDWP